MGSREGSLLCPVPRSETVGSGDSPCMPCCETVYLVGCGCCGCPSLPCTVSSSLALLLVSSRNISFQSSLPSFTSPSMPAAFSPPSSLPSSEVTAAPCHPSLLAAYHSSHPSPPLLSLPLPSPPLSSPPLPSPPLPSLQLMYSVLEETVMHWPLAYQPF